MPKINVYLPDHLAAQVKAAGIPVSPICQQALADAVAGVARVRRAAEVLRNPATAPPALALISSRVESHMTARLARAAELARESASRRGGAHVTTADLLAGIIDEGENLGVLVLQSLEVDLEDRRAAAGSARPEQAPPGAPGEDGPSLAASLSMAARAAVASALEESVAFGHNYLGCEHLLLGLARTAEGAAEQLLRDSGADEQTVRRAVKTALAGYARAKEAAGDDSGRKLEEVLSRLDSLERRLEALGT